MKRSALQAAVMVKVAPRARAGRGLKLAHDGDERQPVGRPARARGARIETTGFVLQRVSRSPRPRARGAD